MWTPLLAVVTALTLGACTGGSGGLVLVASSLTDVADDLVASWDGEAAVSEAGSQVLRSQVESGATPDVVLLADPAIAADLADRGLADEPVPVARTGLVVATTNPAVDAPADLADPSLEVVLADRTVPLGRYTREALDRLGTSGQVPPGTAEAILDGADSLEDAARLVLAKLAAGEADAVIVYTTDALAARRGGLDLHTLSLPGAATYTAQLVEPPTRRGRSLIDFLRSARARDVWRDHGFDPAMPDDRAP